MTDTQKTPENNRMVVIHAMLHLKVIEKSLKHLCEDKTSPGFQEHVSLAEARRDLILKSSVYQEAVWRRSIGQRAKKRADGKFDIYDKFTGSHVSFEDMQPTTVVMVDGLGFKPGDTVRLTNQGENGLPDGNYKIKNAVAAETPLKDRDKKRGTNKLTYEQRRQNGLRGIAIREENQRSRKAREDKRFYLYGCDNDEKPIMLGKTGYFSMKSAFVHLTRNFNSYDTFIIYDNKGQRWNYDSASHNMVTEKA